MTDDVRKLLGGYATGTLTDAEKQLLYDAALHDNELFAALADEQALKELLDDGAVRAQLLRATEEPRFSFAVAFREWFDRPKAKALVATAAVLLAIIGFKTTRQELEQKPEQVAKVHRPSALEAPPPPPVLQPQSKPAPQQARKAVKPKQEARNSISAPPAPPPPAAKEASRDAVAGGVVGGIVGGVPSSAMARFKAAASEETPPLRYELLLKGPDGEFRVVPPDHEFTPGDLVRIRVTSTQNGAIAVSTNGATLSGSVIANQATTIPETGGISITPKTGPLVLKFADSDTTKSVEVPIRRRP